MFNFNAMKKIVIYTTHGVFHCGIPYIFFECLLILQLQYLVDNIPFPSMSTNPLNITNTDVRNHMRPKCFQVNISKHLEDE